MSKRGVYRKRFYYPTSYRAVLFPGVVSGTPVLNPGDYPPTGGPTFSVNGVSTYTSINGVSSFTSVNGVT